MEKVLDAARQGGYPWQTVSREHRPLCAHHDEATRMELHSLHSDASRPGEVVGLYECPECGHQQRVPVETAA